MDLHQLDAAGEIARQMYEDEIILHGRVPLDSQQPLHQQSADKLMFAAMACGAKFEEIEYFSRIALKIFAAFEAGAKFRSQSEMMKTEPRGNA